MDHVFHMVPKTILNSCFLSDVVGDIQLPRTRDGLGMLQVNIDEQGLPRTHNCSGMSDGDIRTRLGLWFLGPYGLHFSLHLHGRENNCKPMNIAVFGDIQQFPSETESRRKYIPESDYSDGMVPGLATAE